MYIHIAVSPGKKDVQGALFISAFPPSFARGSQKHEIDCVNKKTKMSLVYVFRWQAFETGQNPEPRTQDPRLVKGAKTYWECRSK